MKVQIENILFKEKATNNQLAYLNNLLTKNPFKSYNRFSGKWSNLIGKMIDKELASSLINALVNKKEIVFFLGDKRASQAKVKEYYFYGSSK